MVTAIDLFCGAGGMSAGLAKAGIEVICGFDSWQVAIKTYSQNFPGTGVCLDISKQSAADLWKRAGRLPFGLDLLVGGPPCQGFSVQRIGADHDHRNNLVLEFGRLVREFQPRMFLMENVPGLLGKRGLHLATQFEDELRDHGYDVARSLVNAAEYGIPQIRKRIFFYGWLRDEVAPFSFPNPKIDQCRFNTVWDAIGTLPEPADDPSLVGDDPLHRRTRLSPLNVKRLEHIPPGGGMENLPVELRVNCHKNGPDRIGHRYVYGRLAPDAPAGTITARFDSFTRGKFAHPFSNRNITLREGARLQTFPDDFVFTGSQEEIAAQIGNAVPPLLALQIGRAIRNHLEVPRRSSQSRAH